MYNVSRFCQYDRNFDHIISVLAEQNGLNLFLEPLGKKVMQLFC
jgi:hypothetical protein